jgi:hypothetical protein
MYLNESDNEQKFKDYERFNHKNKSSKTHIYLN